MHRKHQPKSGFTLVEMLVVMAIISILAAMIVTVVINVRINAQIAATTAMINVITSAIDSYKAEYIAPPPVYKDWGYEPDSDMDGAGASAVTPTDYIFRNELLREWLTTRFDGFGMSGGTGPFLHTNQITYQDDTTDSWKPGMIEFCDAWGVPLVFTMPGLDHSGEVDATGNRVNARNNMMLRITTTAGDWDHQNAKYDLYSVGPNGTDETGHTTGTLGETTKDGGTWGHTCSAYDPTKGVGDDIGNWKFANKRTN